jgi:hypothetical protein
LLNKLDRGWCWMIAQRPCAELREDSLIGCQNTGDKDSEGENTCSYACRASENQPVTVQASVTLLWFIARYCRR